LSGSARSGQFGVFLVVAGIGCFWGCIGCIVVLWGVIVLFSSSIVCLDGSVVRDIMLDTGTLIQFYVSLFMVDILLFCGIWLAIGLGM